LFRHRIIFRHGDVRPFIHSSTHDATPTPFSPICRSRLFRAVRQTEEPSATRRRDDNITPRLSPRRAAVYFRQPLIRYMRKADATRRRRAPKNIYCDADRRRGDAALRAPTLISSCRQARQRGKIEIKCGGEGYHAVQYWRHATPLCRSRLFQPRIGCQSHCLNSRHVRLICRRRRQV